MKPKSAWADMKREATSVVQKPSRQFANVRSKKETNNSNGHSVEAIVCPPILKTTTTKMLLQKKMLQRIVSSLPMPHTHAICWQKEEWHRVLLQLSKCKTYIELKQKITSNPLPPPLMTIKRAIEEDDLIDSLSHEILSIRWANTKVPN